MQNRVYKRNKKGKKKMKTFTTLDITMGTLDDFKPKKNKTLKAWRLENFPTSNNYLTVYGYDSLDVIKEYDLASRGLDYVRIVELEGEELAIALSNLD